MARDPEPWQDRLETATRSATGARRELADLELPALTVLAHPDPSRVGERAVLTDLAAGRSVAISRLEPRFSPSRGQPPRPLADSRLSRRPWYLSPSSGGAVVVDPGGGSTRLTVDGSPATSPRISSAEDLRRGVILLLARHVVLLLHTFEASTRVEPCPGLLGESTAMLRVHREIRRVADLDFPVLLRGESGTGKELVARALHDVGPRRGQPYLAVNVAAVPPTLAAAELFGAARGAYSGADRRRPGFFHRAHGGTLFLDEIGEAPPDVQALLLRALESGEVQSVGAEAPEPVDVRVVSATDADLEAAIGRGEFRSPLLHRLAGYEIVLPPLRDRREDFGRLFFHFLSEELAKLGESEYLAAAGPDEEPWVDAEVVARLAAYDWPGNVRQLKNVVRQLAVGNRGKVRMQLGPKIAKLLEATAVPPRPEPEGPSSPGRAAAGSYRDPDQISERELRAALVLHRFEPTPSAEHLGVSRPSLYNLMARHGIRRASELGRDEIELGQKLHGMDVDALAEHLEVSKRGLKMRMKELGLR